ncbi:hypothetical protein PVAG01_02116 [Phlyctema vagabunda]|uniref:Fungal N-terminal domain-containing protein n=1 Tax=Phlyctema vagabunda TaxID=108571 RepID=A0ABR4PPU0_9HELO
MAEAVGLVASGISIGTLAVQIAVSLKKLRSYWQDVKDAQQDVNDIVERTELLQSLLAQLDADQSRNPVSSMLLGQGSMISCLAHCEKAARSLEDLVEDLSRNIDSKSKSKRLRAANRVVFNKDKLDRYERKLGNALQLLSFANQSYSMSLLQQQPEIIVSRVLQAGVVIANSHHLSQNETLSQAAGRKSNITSLNRRSQNYLPRSFMNYLFGSMQISVENQQICEALDQRYYEVYINARAPAWLVNKCWEIQARGVYTGWEFRFTISRTHSENSTVDIAIKNDHVEQLKAYFQRGEVGISDTFVCGYMNIKLPILNWAAIAGSTNVCHFLLDCGAFVNDEIVVGDTRNDYTDCPLACLSSFESLRVVSFPTNKPLTRQLQVSGLARRLIKSTTLIDIRCLNNFGGTYEIFCMLQEKCYLEYYKNDISERLVVAGSIAMNATSNEARTFRRALFNTNSHMMLRDCDDQSINYLVNCISVGIGSFLRIGRWNGLHFRPISRNQDWLAFLLEAIYGDNKSDGETRLKKMSAIQAYERSIYTPLQLLIRALFLSYLPPA